MVETVSLRDVARIDRKSIAPEKIATGSKYVGLENIESGGRLINVGTVANGELASSKFVFTSEHVLYGKLRPYLAKIALPEFDGICSTDIVPVLPGSKLDRRFLVHFLRQPNKVQLANSLATGANLPRLSPSALGEIDVPLPPLDEQRRIAAILDKADELRTKRRQTLAHLDALTQSIFLTMFGDPASNPRGLAVSTLGAIGRWQSGGTPLRSVSAFFKGDIPWYTSGELNSKFLGSTIEMITAEAVVQSSAKIIPSGSLLLGMYDTAALKSGISIVPSSCNQAIAFGVLDPRIAVTDYVYQCIQTAKEHYRQLQRGVRQKNLNLSMIRDLEIPLPPLQDQQQFGAKVAAVERIKEKQLTHLKKLDSVFASLQHRAFQGEL